MPTTTFSIATGTDDQMMHNGYGTAWPPETHGGTYSRTTTATAEYAAKNNAGSALYVCQNVLFRWDTSSLTAQATITSAVLRVWVMDVKNDNSRSVEGDYYSWTGSSNSDYTSGTSQTAITDVPLSSLTVGADNDLTLNSPDTSINKTGTTHVRLMISGASPTGSSVFNEVQVAMSEHTTNPEPRLVVTYSLGGDMVGMIGS